MRLFSLNEPQTKCDEAWVLGIAAKTMIVTTPPTMTKNMPTCWVYGRRRLAKMMMIVLIHNTSK